MSAEYECGVLSDEWIQRSPFSNTPARPEYKASCIGTKVLGSGLRNPSNPVTATIVGKAQ